MNRFIYGALLTATSYLMATNQSHLDPSYPPISMRNGRSLLPGADLNIDYLYWTAREDGLEYAYDGSSPGGSTNATAGQVYHPNSQWQSGYKVGLAAYTAYDGWELWGQYTWYKLSTMGFVYDSDNLKPTWKIANITSNLGSASSNWSLNFNTVDLLLRRKFFLSPKFLVQPAVGMKFAITKQTYMVTYDQASSNTSGNMHIVQKTNGAGISGAVATNWYITKPVSVYSRAAVSTLWFNSTPHRTDTQESSQNYFVYLDTQEKLSYAAPVLEMFLGLSFESTLYKNKIQAIFQAGYEFQIWFDANQFERTILDANGTLGNLSLQGLTLRGQLEF